jgi:hypothetical protein
LLASAQPEAASSGDASADEAGRRVVRCMAIPDFYQAPSRAMISTILRPFLDQLVITPVELLHSSRNQMRLDGAGTLLRDATEKTAAMQARAIGQSVPARVRELGDLVTSLINNMRAIEQNQPVMPLKEGGFAQAVRAIRQQTPADQIDIKINRMLTEYLSGARTWAEKLDKVIALADEAIGSPELFYIDALIGEVLQSEVAQENLLGRRVSVEDRIDDLIELYKAEYPQRRKEPASAAAGKLVGLLRSNDMPETRSSIETVIIQQLASRNPLRSPELLMELKATYALLAKLRFGETAIGGRRALEFIDKRTNRLLTAEAVTDYIRGSITLGERILALFDIYSVTFGPTNRKNIEEFIHRYFSGDDFDRRILQVEGTPQHKLKILSGLYGAVVKSSLATPLKTDYARLLIKLQAGFIAESHFFASLDRKNPSSAKKAVLVLSMCLEGYFIPGENLERAKSVVRHYLGRPDFMARFLEAAPAPQAQQEMLRGLKQKLSALGIEPPFKL